MPRQSDQQHPLNIRLKSGRRRLLSTRRNLDQPGDAPTNDIINPDIPQTHRLSKPKAYPPGSVIASAIWRRDGTSSAARKWQAPNKTSWTAWLERTLHTVEAKYYQHTPGTSAASDAAHHAQVVPILSSGFDPTIFAECWELSFLGTDPRWHRQGAGSLCIRWGLERAQAEKVPAVVGASSIGYGAYVKNGFVPLRRLVELDRLFEVQEPGMWVLVKEPEGRMGNWIERAKELERDKMEGEGKRMGRRRGRRRYR